MIYQLNNMLLNVTQQILSNDINDVIICQDIAAVTKTFYTVIVIKDNDIAKKVLAIYDAHPESVSTYVTRGTYEEKYLLVYPYFEERPIRDFFKAEIIELEACEKLCKDVVIKCVTSQIPYPIMHLLIKQKCINKSKGGDIYFCYNLDLSELSMETDERVCVNSCAAMLFSLLSNLTDDSTISYTLLKKKTARAGYYKFIDLYKDIQVATEKIEKKSIFTKIKKIFNKNKHRLLRILITLCIIAVIIAVIMILSQLVFGDIPFLRLFINSFEEIGTESLNQ